MCLNKIKVWRDTDDLCQYDPDCKADICLTLIFNIISQLYFCYGCICLYLLFTCGKFFKLLKGGTELKMFAMLYGMPVGKSYPTANPYKGVLLKYEANQTATKSMQPCLVVNLYS